MKTFYYYIDNEGTTNIFQPTTDTDIYFEYVKMAVGYELKSIQAKSKTQAIFKIEELECAE